MKNLLIIIGMGFAINLSTGYSAWAGLAKSKAFNGANSKEEAIGSSFRLQALDHADQQTHQQANKIGNPQGVQSIKDTESAIAAQLKEIEEFYTEESFPKNVLAEIHSHVQMADAAISTTELKTIFPDQCDVVIDQVATVVHQEISDVLLDEPKDLPKACPQWETLTRDEKKEFYVALVTSMALAESGCSNKAVNNSAPDGRAYGLWQAPKRMSPAAGARWTLAKLEDQVSQSGLLFWANSKRNYWSVLNPKLHAGKVKKVLKKIPVCAAKAMSRWERFK